MPAPITIAEVPNIAFCTPIFQDAATLLSDEAFAGHVNPERVRIGIEASHLVIAMAHNGDLVGAGVLRPTSDTTAAITCVAVSPDKRRDGLGTRIISKLEDIAVASQVATILVMPTNTDARRLCERLGYTSPHDNVRYLEKSL